jgi:FkbM family methyltransferase
MKINIYELGNYYIPDSVKNGKCVDIGANCGTFTLRYALFFKTIHFYEPISELFNLIKERTANYNNVLGFNEAVLDKDGQKVSIYLHSNNDSGSSAIKSDIMTDSYRNDWTDTIVQKDVKTVSLETILSRIGDEVDYMKIDCETSEYLLLINKDLSKIKHLCIEVHTQLGESKWNELITHILLYFNNPNNQDLSYDSTRNKEFYFINKSINPLSM